MNILCDKCIHKPVCSNAKDFGHIINRLDATYRMASTKVSESKHINNFEWFSYIPHCKYFCESKPILRETL